MCIFPTATKLRRVRLMKSSALSLLAFSALVFAPQAKADFLYYVHDTFGSINVEFESPTFQQSFENLTSLGAGSSNLGPVSLFSLSGGSAGCSGPFVSISPGPCLASYGPTSNGAYEYADAGPAFTGPGTFTAGSATVTILQTPEPVSGLLLLTVLAGVSLVARKRQVRQPFRYPE